MPFTVKTAAFEGPLDLLLDLIEKRKLFISDVSLASVTDDFISHIRQLGTMPMGESAHFILVASTLLLIKSKSLLPELTLSEEEQGDIRDLETRLKIYKRIKEASIDIGKLFGQRFIFGQNHARVLSPVFAPARDVSLERILASMQDLVRRFPRNESLPQKVVAKVISLEEMIGDLTMRISRSARMSFSDFTKGHRENRVNVIVSFLAMLELVKEGIVTVSQDAHFGDIQMETASVTVPHY